MSDFNVEDMSDFNVERLLRAHVRAYTATHGTDGFTTENFVASLSKVDGVKEVLTYLKDYETTINGRTHSAPLDQLLVSRAKSMLHAFLGARNPYGVKRAQTFSRPDKIEKFHKFTDETTPSEWPLIGNYARDNKYVEGVDLILNEMTEKKASKFAEVRDLVEPVIFERRMRVRNARKAAAQPPADSTPPTDQP